MNVGVQVTVKPIKLYIYVMLSWDTNADNAKTTPRLVQGLLYMLSNTSK